MRLYVISKIDGKKHFLKPKFYSENDIPTRKVFEQVIGGKVFTLNDMKEQFKIEEVFAETNIDSNLKIVLFLSSLIAIPFAFSDGLSLGMGAFSFFFILFFIAAELDSSKERGKVFIFNNS